MIIKTNFWHNLEDGMEVEVKAHADVDGDHDESQTFLANFTCHVYKNGKRISDEELGHEIDVIHDMATDLLWENVNPDPDEYDDLTIQEDEREDLLDYIMRE